MKIQGTNSLMLFNDFDPARREINKKFHKEKSEHVEKALLEKAKLFYQEEGISTDPKIDDFAYIMFRHISKAIVGGGSYKATDFSKGNVLKESVKMLDGVNAYTNHFAYVGNQIGKVLNPEWSNGFTNTKGDKVPAGINAPFVIDKVLHPKLVRELNSPVGSPIDSASVTVYFTWEASHEFEHDHDFYYHIGEMVEGEMVRRIAQEVVEYEESSLVWSGADPYAKILHKPQLLQQEELTASNKFSANPELRRYDSGRTFFIFDSQNEAKILKFEEASLSFSSELNSNPKTKGAMKLEALMLIAAVLGLKPDEVTKESLNKVKVLKTEDFDALNSNEEKIKQLELDKANLSKEKDDIVVSKTTIEEQLKTANTEKEALQKAADAGKIVLENAKKETKSLYEKFSNGKPDEKILAEIEASADIEALEAKAKMFGGQLYQKFGAHCEECGSTSISLRSSKGGEDDDDETYAEVEPMYLQVRE